jgi:hypothetical protein
LILAPVSFAWVFLLGVLYQVLRISTRYFKEIQNLVTHPEFKDLSIRKEVKGRNAVHCFSIEKEDTFDNFVLKTLIIVFFFYFAFFLKIYCI